LSNEAAFVAVMNDGRIEAVIASALPIDEKIARFHAASPVVGALPAARHQRHPSAGRSSR
jgi:hypothetical protein